MSLRFNHPNSLKNGITGCHHVIDNNDIARLLWQGPFNLLHCPMCLLFLANNESGDRSPFLLTSVRVGTDYGS